MEKEARHDIFDEILDGPEKQKIPSKNTLGLTITPGAVIGALTGAALARHKTLHDAKISSLPRSEPATFADKGYYQQVDNLIKNLEVTFTPLSVLYSVKNGKRDVVFETLSLDRDMTPEMRSAWINKDGLFFRNLLVNKIRSDTQLVEQHFAEKLIGRHFGPPPPGQKQAELGLFPILEKTAAAKAEYCRDQGVAERTAVLFEKLAGDTVVEIQIGLDPILEDYLDVGESYDFLSYGEKYASFADPKYLTPNYLLGRLKIVYFPDRVLFVVDNKVISTLHMAKMSETALERFYAKDNAFFRRLFEDEARFGHRVMRERDYAAVAAVAPLEKKASAVIAKPAALFLLDSGHPAAYQHIMLKKFGKDWLKMDFSVLFKMIEDAFKLETGLNDIVVNKLMAIRACNLSQVPYTVPHAFEKILRSFNNLPINWLVSEFRDITLADVAFGLDAFDLVTPEDDTYDNFTPEIMAYLVQILRHRNSVYFMPDDGLIVSPLHTSFYRQLNRDLLDAANNEATLNLAELSSRAQAICDNEMVQTLAASVLTSVQENGSYILSDKKLLAIIKQNGSDPRLLDVVKNQVEQNLAVNAYLQSKIKELGSQLELFGLMPGDLTNG